MTKLKQAAVKTVANARQAGRYSIAAELDAVLNEQDSGERTMSNTETKTWACFVVLDGLAEYGTVTAATEGGARKAFIDSLTERMPGLQEGWQFEAPYQGVFIVEAASGASVSWT